MIPVKLNTWEIPQLEPPRFLDARVLKPGEPMPDMETEIVSFIVCDRDATKQEEE